MGLHLKQVLNPLVLALMVSVAGVGTLYAQSDPQDAKPAPAEAAPANAEPAKAAPEQTPETPKVERQIVTEPAKVAPETAETPAPAETPETAEKPKPDEAPEQAEKEDPAALEKADTPAKEDPAALEKADTPPKAAPAQTSKKFVAYQPANPLEEAAQAVLAKHCARCHQEGALTERKRPAKGVSNVLDLKAIAATPSLILPGNPDGSKLYQQIVNEEMPYDLFNEGDFDKPQPTEKELLALRSWITSLGETAKAACNTRDFIDNAAVVKAISDDLNSLKEHKLAGTRYITLTNLYNACATDEEMKVFAQGVVKLLNSLSRHSDVVTLNTIDKAGTIIRFHLDDLRWDASHWNRLLSVYPYASKPDTNLYRFLTHATHTSLPYIRGDWFAYTASRPPLYHDLLKLPKTFKGLTQQLGVDVAGNIEKFLAKRAGFQRSGVSVNNRLIERHTISTGVFWTSYDFAGNKRRQSLFDFPMGPHGKNSFKADGGETIFSLPNGFNGYYLNLSSGKRINKGPIAIVRDPTKRDQSVTNGISCFGCHDQGFRKAKDDIRDHVMKDRSNSKRVRDAIEALHPPHAEMDKLLASDASRFKAAMKRAGLDPALKLNGVEMINALSDKYEQNVDVRLAAAEFGLKPKSFLDAMSQAGGKVFALKRRLEQGLVPRDQFEGFYAELVPQVIDEEMISTAKIHVKGAKVAKVNTASHKVSHKFDLALFSDRSNYHVRDLPVFTVKSNVNCHLSLINVDHTGHATVIFPNKYQRKNFLRAGQTLQFPGPKAPFQFRLRDKGVETVIAVCNATGKNVDGIKHKFRKKAFTDLGDYGKHLTRKIVVEAAKIKAHKGKKRFKNVKIIARAAIKIKVQ